MDPPRPPRPSRSQRPQRAQRTARPEKPLSEAALQRSALWHLQRRALTTTQLQTLLRRKAARAAAVHGEEPRAEAWIDALLLRLSSSLLLDDARVAQARTASLRARGASSRRISQKLREAGVAHDDAKVALAAVDDGDARAGDLRAAVHVVRKKRLRDKDPRKALAALARLGFSYDVAKRALEADDAAASDDDHDNRDG